MESFLRHIPNLLTLLRLVIAGLFISAPERQWLPLLLFAFASDYLDGALCRAFGWGSKLGQFLDPVADKALFFAVAYAFHQNGKVTIVQLLLLGVRDLFVVAASFFLWATGQRRPTDNLEPNVFGKLTTVAQYMAFFSCFFESSVDRDLVGITFVFGVLASALYVVEHSSARNPSVDHRAHS